MTNVCLDLLGEVREHVGTFVKFLRGSGIGTWRLIHHKLVLGSEYEKRGIFEPSSSFYTIRLPAFDTWASRAASKRDRDSIMFEAWVLVACDTYVLGKLQALHRELSLVLFEELLLGEANAWMLLCALFTLDQYDFKDGAISTVGDQVELKTAEFRLQKLVKTNHDLKILSLKVQVFHCIRAISQVNLLIVLLDLEFVKWVPGKHSLDSKRDD